MSLSVALSACLLSTNLLTCGRSGLAWPRTPLTPLLSDSPAVQSTAGWGEGETRTVFGKRFESLSPHVGGIAQ